MRISLGSKQHFESGSWLEAVLEILVGSLTGSIRACYIVTTGVYLNVIRPMASVLGIRFPTGKRKKMLGGKIKVAAVGFGRTGTVR